MANFLKVRSGWGMKGLDLLKGVRIVEQGTFITGPCTGMMLADLGADVIKLESPDGDPYRAYQGDNYSPHFQAYNRNKRSLALDMKQPGERAMFDTLIREADVFIQNFRPGTADRLGAGASAIAGTQSEADLLLHQRIRRQWSLCGSAQLRFRGAGAERFPERGGGSGAAAFPRPRAGRRHHRHLRGLWRAGRIVRSQPHRAWPRDRSVHARSHGAFRHRALHGVFRTGHRARFGGSTAAGAGAHPAHR